MKKLHYSVTIEAPKEVVWETMLGKEGYKQWTSEFAEGSYYEGTWEKGEKLKFLMPGGEGMSSVVEELKPYEYSSVKHMRAIKNFEEQTEDESGFTYPAYEKYTLIDQNGTTIVKASVEMPEKYVDDMDDMFPRALQKLKMLCEEKVTEKDRM